jgi:hypothetical protein
MGDTCLPKIPRKNVGIPTRSGISKGTVSKRRRRIRRKRKFIMMILKFFSRGWWRWICCSFGNLCRLECMADKIWSFLPYYFPSELVFSV